MASKANEILVISIVGLTLIITWQKNHVKHYQPSYSDVTLSLFSQTHFDTLTFKLIKNKRIFCDTMLMRYHRKLEHAWLGNIGHCYQSLNNEHGTNQVQAIIQLGMRSTPNNIELNLLRVQSLLKTKGIQSTEFRTSLLELRKIAPTHRTTLWLASAEAYYRGERSQALAFLSQLQDKVGDEPEILEFIDAVKALPQ